MRELSRGADAPLPGVATIRLTLAWEASPAPIDVVAFVVGTNGRVGGDDDFVFFNQPRHPSGGVEIAPGERTTTVVAAFGLLPATASRCVVAASLDGAGALRQVRGLTLTATPDAGEPFLFRVTDLSDERSLIVAELYRHGGGWKIRAVGQGFRDGLAPLARHYGVDVADEPAPTPALAAPPPVALDPAFARAFDVRRQLARAAFDGTRVAQGAHARVACLFDATGTAEGLYADGTMQRVVERALALAAALDPHQAADVWFYADRPWPAGRVSASAAGGFVTRTYPRVGYMTPCGLGNDEPAALDAVVARCLRDEPVTAPVLALVHSDGDVHADRAIVERIVATSGEPIFWQFVGLGAGEFGGLARVDEIPGRPAPNAAFLEVLRPDTVDEAEFYARIAAGYAHWLETARRLGIVARC